MASYKPDYRGTAELMRTPEMLAVVVRAATDAIPFAKSISPDAPPYGAGYIASFTVEPGIEKISRARRAVAELLNTSNHALIVEVGVGYHVGNHVLARTADHIERG